MTNPQSPAANEINIVYHETSKELEMKTHFHNSHEIIYVLEGTAQFNINNKIYTCESNSLLFISNLESHELKVIKYPYKRYFLLIKPDYFHSILKEPVLASILKNRPEHFTHVLAVDGTNRQFVSELFAKMYSESSGQKDFWQQSLGSYLLILLVFLYRNYNGFFPITTVNSSMCTVIEIQKHIEKHYMEEISLKEIARQFYTDMFYLSHLFKKVTGFSFKEYLILQRISRAKDRLFYTSDPVTRVAQDSGFNNVNHFIRIFKKFEGLTPYQYRKIHRG